MGCYNIINLSYKTFLFQLKNENVNKKGKQLIFVFIIVVIIYADYIDI